MGENFPRPKGDGTVQGDTKPFGQGDSMASPYKLGGSLGGKSEAEVRKGYCAEGKLGSATKSDGMDGA